MCIYLTDIFSSEDICSSSVECRTSPLRRFSQSSLQLHKNPYSLSTFCTEHNVQECLSHISQVGNLTSDVLLAPSFICDCSGSKICDCCAPCLNLAGPLHPLLFILFFLYSPHYRRCHLLASHRSGRSRAAAAQRWMSWLCWTACTTWFSCTAGASEPWKTWKWSSLSPAAMWTTCSSPAPG